jgi:hypothetical protein
MKKCFFSQIGQRIGLLLSMVPIVCEAQTPPTFIPTRCGDPLTVNLSPSSAEIPTPLRKPPPVIPLGCERPFLYQGELYSSDPPQAQDASTLKYFVKDVPEANAILEKYEVNREKSKISAYTGTFGLLLIALAGVISRKIRREDPDYWDAGLIHVGELAAAGGFIYSFTLLRTNEALLPKAVEAYNQAKPNNPIELKFSTGWTF